MKLMFSLAAGLAFSAVVSTHAVVVEQIDTFEDGTTQNWAINLLGMGSPPPEALPSNISSGGPAGADDNYLRLTSVGGLQAGGRLTAINFNGQWAGDYLAAGINAIQMDVINLGNTDLSLRLLFEDPLFGPPQNVAVSSGGIDLPAGGGWQTILFPVGLLDLSALQGSVEDALQNATALRIFHGTTAAFPGEPSLAQLGVDNIRAVQVPQSVPDAGTTAALLSVSAAGLALFRKRAQS